MEKHYVLKFNDSEKDYKIIFSKDCETDLTKSVYIVKPDVNWAEPPVGMCDLGRDEDGIYIDNATFYRLDSLGETILDAVFEKFSFSISGFILKKEGEVVTSFRLDYILIRGKMDEDQINKNTELPKPG